jgi:hypothetical protein
MAIGIKVNRAAMYLICFEERRGTRAIIMAPITGRKTMIER